MKKKEKNEALIFGSFFVIANKLQTIADRYLSDSHLTAKQYFLLYVVERFGSQKPTLGQVAREMGSSHQNIKQLAVKLEQKGYIEIKKDYFDGRTVRLQLTPKCQEYRECRRDEDERFLEWLFIQYSDEEREQLLKLTNKFFQRMLAIDRGHDTFTKEEQ